MDSNEVVAQLTITICGAVAAGLLALLGSWVGSHWGRRTEHAQWFRNEQIRHVGRFLHVLSQLSFDMSDFTDVKRGSPEHKERWENLRNRMLEASDPTFRMVATKELVAHAEALQTCLLEKADAVNMPSGAERNQRLTFIAKKYDHLEEAMINCVRGSFGAKGLLNFYPAPKD